MRSMLSPSPKNTKCIHCILAYATRANHRKRIEDRGLTKFGQIVTCDHVHMQDYWDRPGMGGMNYLFNCYDLPTDFRMALATKDQGFQTTEEQMRQFLGSSLPCSLMYADRHAAVALVCRKHSIPLRNAPPGDFQSNGVLEQLNRRIQGGIRAHLRSAGLP